MSELARPDGGYRLGIAVDRDQLAGALVDTDGVVIAATTRRLTGEQTPDAVLAAVLEPLLAHPAARECTVADIDRTAFALSQDRVIIDTGDDRLDVDPGAMQRARCAATIFRLPLAKLSCLRLQFGCKSCSLL